ncbi:8859_t:CDS:1, partial [Racocetra fulgida]
KLNIITYLEENEISIKEVSKKFNIQPNQLRDWIHNKEMLIKASPNTFKLHNRCLPYCLQIEETLYHWITEQCQLQNPITQELVTVKAASLTQNTAFQNLL